MKHFFEYFKLPGLFSKPAPSDVYYLSEVTKNYARLWNPEMVKLFLQNYAIAMTERETTMYLRSWWAKPEHQTYREIKKLLDVIDQIENFSWQENKKAIR
jgi:hypothetical protein